MFLNQEHMNYKFANIYMHDNMNIDEMWGSGWNLWEKKIKKKELPVGYFSCYGVILNKIRMMLHVSK